MDIRMGVPVDAADGRAGKVERLVYDPGTGDITGIVVVEGWLLPQDVVVPISMVESAGEQSLKVRATVEEIRQLPPFSVAQYTEPPADWMPPIGMAASAYLFPASPYAVGAFTPPSSQLEPNATPEENLAPGTIDIGPDSEVFCTDGSGGHVERVLTSGDSDHITHLVVRHGALFAHHVVVPIEDVRTTDHRGVHLRLTEEQLEKLPRFQS